MAITKINKPIKQIQLPGDTTVYDIAAVYDGRGEKIEEKYLQLAGGTITGPIKLGGGDGVAAGKIILPNRTSTQAGGQITDDSTSTLFGIINANELTLGHGSYKLLLRGKDGDSAGPTYNGKKIILESNLAGTAGGVVKQDDSGDVNISNGIITVKDNSHSHSLTSTISDWSTVRATLVEEWQEDVAQAVSDLVNGAPDDLKTLDALAAALGDDASLATNLTKLIGEKVAKYGDTMTGPLTIKHENESSNPYIKLETKYTGNSTLDRIWYIQSWKGPSDSEPYLYIGGSASGGQNPIKISDDGKLITNNSFSANKGVFIVSDETIGTDGSRVKILTSNGGALYFGTEGANNGTMFRFDQTAGTCRLRFRASNAAGAMVWEQPEEGAYLCLDLGKKEKDYRRTTFKNPGSGKNIYAENLDITGNAATATKPNLTGTANALIHFNSNGTTFAKTNTANGALYATAANGAMQFGTLPVEQGGTGATTKSGMRSNFEVPHLNSSNTFDGEQRMANTNYCPTLYDIASGIGCSLKNTRALDNQAIIGELLLPPSADSGDGTANTSNVVANEMGVYIISNWGKLSSDPNHGKITSKTPVGKFTKDGWVGNASSLYDSVTATAGKLKWEGDYMLYAENHSGSKLHFGTDALYRHISTGYLKLLDAGNYNSYSPTLDGTGATGTWRINITGNASSADSVVWTNVSNRPGNASESAAGFMSADDKKKLNGVAVNANNYSLPNATSSVLGGVKIGSNITVSSGTISLTKTNVTTALGYTPPTTDTTYSASTGLSLNGTAFSVNFANSTLYKVGDDAWFGDQDVAGAFCIKGNNGNTSLRMIGYKSGAANLIYNSSDKCIDITFN